MRQIGHLTEVVRIRALISLFQIKTDESTHIYYYNTTLLTLYITPICFSTQKGHPQGVRLIHFSREGQQNELPDVNSGIQIKHTYK